MNAVIGGMSSTAAPAAPDADNPFAKLRDAKEAARPSPVKFPPTPEQEMILDGFRKGQDMVIAAGAGTGKTSTITLLAEELHRSDPTAKAIYITFNAAMAAEIKGRFFYGNVDAMTVHGLANRGCRADATLSKLMPKLGDDDDKLKYGWQIAKHFRFPSVKLTADMSRPAHPTSNPMLFQVTGRTACEEALEALRRWCSSDADEVGREHVAAPEGMDKRVRGAWRDEIVKIARKVWSTDIMSPTGVVKFNHDYYMKAWMLTNPDIVSTFKLDGRKVVLFFDEAQDARPCMTNLVMAQRGRIQVVMCGDSSQSIYRFLGCRDAIRGFKTFDKVHAYNLSKTFRFGPAVAKVANQVLNRIAGSDVRIVPEMNKPSVVVGIEGGDGCVPVDENGKLPTAAICRDNAGMVDMAVELTIKGYNVYCEFDRKRVLGLAYDIHELACKRPVKRGPLKDFHSYDELERKMFNRKDDASEFIASSSADEEVADVEENLKSIIRAIITNTPSRTINAINSMVADPAQADITLSTIHKAKGKQWGSVYVYWNPDRMIAASLKGTDSFNDELMLFYVAVTRAEEALIIPKMMASFLHINTSSSVAYSGDASMDSVTDELDSIIAASDEGRVIETVRLLDAVFSRVDVRILKEVVTHDIPPHLLVKAAVFVQEHVVPITRYANGGTPSTEDIGVILPELIAGFGVQTILDAAELVDNEFPVEIAYPCLVPVEDSPVDMQEVGGTYNAVLGQIKI